MFVQVKLNPHGVVGRGRGVYKGHIYLLVCSDFQVLTLQCYGAQSLQYIPSKKRCDFGKITTIQTWKNVCIVGRMSF